MPKDVSGGKINTRRGKPVGTDVNKKKKGKGEEKGKGTEKNVWSKRKNESKRKLRYATVRSWVTRLTIRPRVEQIALI